MKIVVGVDPGGLYREAIHLLGRLKFVDAQIVLAHVRPPILTPAFAGALPAPTEQQDRAAHESSEHLLEDAESATRSRVGESVTTVSLEGSAPREIMELAETERADLVAVGSRRQGTLGSVILGSTGRALAIGAAESFLVARGGISAEGNVRAIFATDHSPYADRCLDELLRLDPQGIAELQIVFAADGDTDTLRKAVGLPDRLDLGSEELMEKVRERGAVLVDKCTESGRLAEYTIVEDYAINVLRKRMYDGKADLLILGAQGHGFLSRLLIGSLSLHAVVAEPFSVMVIRAGEGPR